MNETLRTLPDFSEVYDLYKGRRPDLPEDETSAIEPIDISDRGAVQTAMNKFAEEIYPKFNEVLGDDPNGQTRTYDEEKITKTCVPLGEVVVDDSVPLTLNVYKNFTNERGIKTESINFYLYKGGQGAEEFVGDISLVDRGEEGLEIIDRLVVPKFRGQGFGTMFFECAKAFIQKVSNERQKTVKSFAKTSQLDVIYLFWKNGYRPETAEDWQNLEMIMSGHEDLELAERYYVFRKNTPDKEKYFVSPDGELIIENGKRVINFNNAFRIKMVKSFEAGEDENVEKLRGETRQEAEGIQKKPAEGVVFLQ